MVGKIIKHGDLVIYELLVSGAEEFCVPILKKNQVWFLI